MHDPFERLGGALSVAPSLHRALANAKRGAQRAAALTSRLLAFSRRQALDPKPINLNSFLSGLQEFLQRTLGERIEVQTVGGAGLWQIEADLNHLESTIVNLAINARDAMPNGGKLTIEATNVSADEDYSRINPELVVGQYVVICVSDTGSGMTQEVLSHVFEPFFTTKEPGQGTGLGLSQVYGFVKQSGGHVKIYSEVGEGTSIACISLAIRGIVRNQIQTMTKNLYWKAALSRAFWSWKMIPILGATSPTSCAISTIECCLPAAHRQL